MAQVGSVRIETDYEGIGELLRSTEVGNDLDRRAENVKKAAENRGVTVGSSPAESIPVTTESSRKGKRARARVVLDHPAGLAVESKYRLLVGSLDAARD